MFDLVFKNPNYLANAIAGLGLVGGGFVSWLITFIYFKKGQSRRLLCYATRHTEYLGYGRTDFHNLSIHYAERQVANPVLYKLYVWNCGNVTLNNSDISKVDPLSFGQNNIEILETGSIWSTRDSINPKLMIDAGKAKIIFDFDFLDPGDGFAVQFLVDRATKDYQWPDRLEAYGTIKGLNRAPFRVAATFEKSSWWGRYLGLAAALFCAFSAAVLFYDTWQSGIAVASISRLLAAIIFGLVAIGVAVASFEGFGNGSLIIPALLRRPGDIGNDPQIPPHVMVEMTRPGPLPRRSE